MVNGNSFQFPLELLIPFQLLSALDQPDSCSNGDTDLLNQHHPRDLFSLGLNSLALCTSRLCSFSSIVIEAPSCAAFTRSKLFVLNMESNTSLQNTLPEANCSYMANELPGEIYLGKLETYSIIIQIAVPKGKYFAVFKYV